MKNDSAELIRILTEYKRVAMVGFSANRSRPSHFVAIYLVSKGFDVIPVNPRESEILGRKSYGRLEDIPAPVEIVDIFRDPAAVPGIVDEAISVGAKAIWMQLGVIHEAAAERARAAGLAVVMDRCMKIEYARYFGGLNMLGLNTGLVSSRRREQP